MPSALSRTLIVLNCKKENKKQVVETRKKELKSIFKTFQDISKREIEQVKDLWKSHKSFFSDSEEADEKEIVPVLIQDDDFFKK